MRATRPLLCLGLVLAIVPATLSQTAEPDSPEPDSGEQQAAEAPAAPPQTPPETPADAEPQDPFEYEASEQISEDLSVSFPVDI